MKKLLLNRETVRNLDSVTLKNVLGRRGPPYTKGKCTPDTCNLTCGGLCPMTAPPCYLDSDLC